MDIKQFVEQNWKSTEQLSHLVGQPLSQEMQWNFGSVPTEKALVEVEYGVVSRVRVWSGLNWSAKGGYGSPASDTGKPVASVA